MIYNVFSNIYSVMDIRDEVKSKSVGLECVGGIYKWWCDAKTLKLLFNQLNVSFNIEGVLKFVETTKLNDGTILYCFYVGKSDENLRKRIKILHIGKNGKKNPELGHAIRKSTLRRSINALKNGGSVFDENYVDEVLNKCYVQWMNLHPSDINKKEINEINASIRILNIDDFEENKEFDFYRNQIRKALGDARKT